MKGKGITFRKRRRAIMPQNAVDRDMVGLDRPRNDSLKLIAMVTMLIDHIGYMFFPQHAIFRSVGRLAFPIFAYLLSVGYEKTSSLKNYALRLLAFGLISQVPYAFFSPGLEFEPLELNIMFTLLAALGVMYLYDFGMNRVREYRVNKDVKKLVCGIGGLTAAFLLIMAPEVLESAYEGFGMDYGFYGLLTVLIFHVFKGDKTKTVLSYVVLSFVYTYVYGAKVLAANSIAWFGEEWGIGKALSSFGPVLQNIIWYDYGLVTLGGYFFQARSIFALVPIFMADRLPGKVRLKRYTAYWFYPVHIALLVLTAYILWGGNI
jgi:hypothetical protein